LRVERHLRHELTLAIGRLHDPRLAVVAITSVTLTDDLAFARIYVRAGVDGGGDPRQLLSGLSAASGRLRGEMGRALGLRRAPELRFVYDDGIERAERVEELLAEIEAEARTSAPGLDEE
jgi:ribosome-binding factor A